MSAAELLCKLLCIHTHPGIFLRRYGINRIFKLIEAVNSNADMMLDSTLESPEALKGYAVHPEHVEVANTKIKPFACVRTCLDYEC